MTPVGTAIWPRVNEPDVKFDPDGVYTCDLRLDHEEGKALLAKLEAFVTADKKARKAADEKIHKSKNELPVRLETDRDTGELVETFIVKTKTKRRPLVVDSQKSPVSENVGGGSQLRLSINVKSYNNGAIGYGITLQLKAVQVLELREFSSSGANDFDVVDDGFVATPSSDGDAADGGDF